MVKIGDKAPADLKESKVLVRFSDPDWRYEVIVTKEGGLYVRRFDESEPVLRRKPELVTNQFPLPAWLQINLKAWN